MYVMAFRTQYHHPGDVTGWYEKGGGVSLTIPGQDITCTEMIRRFASGLNITDSKVPLYESESELAGQFPLDYEKWDYAEQEEYTRAHKARMAATEARAKEEKAAKLQRYKDAEAQAAKAPPGRSPQGDGPEGTPKEYPKKLPAEGAPGGPAERN